MLTIAVQAGGESRRMGSNKALMDFLGQPLISRILERVSPLADELLVTTNRPQDFEFLQMPVFPDIIPGRGALGGLYTALNFAKQPLVAVLACDMPFVNPDLLNAEKELLIKTQADIVIPQLDGGLEPFHAIYRRDACLKPVQSAISNRKWRADAWFDQVQLVLFSIQEIINYDPLLLSFKNINTPDDYQNAVQLARSLENKV